MPKRTPVLSDLAIEINALLNERASRRNKVAASKMIIDWLLAHDRLVMDISYPDTPIPHLIADDHSITPINPYRPHPRLHQILSDSGMNPSEESFKWLIFEIDSSARHHGECLWLSHFAATIQNVLYISCGPTRQVKSIIGQPLEILTNTEDNVCFASDDCFPIWEPAEPYELASLSAFNVNFEVPSEVPRYNSVVQMRLLEAWLIAVITNVRPLPILTAIGQMGSGKSTIIRAIVQLLLGSSSNVAPVPESPKDFNACLTSLPIYGIDNLDQPLIGKMAWMIDSLANASTGGEIMERMLYTNNTLHRKPIVASLAISTRTGQFAERSDIAERVCPLFFGPLDDSKRQSEEILYGEIQLYRNGLLSYLAIESAKVLADTTPARGLPGRFQMFAKIVTRERLGEETDQSRNAIGLIALKSLLDAQRLAITDQDPLFTAILHHGGNLEGTATDIIKELEKQGETIPHIGGGKAIARKLREIRPLLDMAGISVRETPWKDRTWFTIVVPISVHSQSVGKSEKSEPVVTSLANQQESF